MKYVSFEIMVDYLFFCLHLYNNKSEVYSLSLYHFYLLFGIICWWLNIVKIETSENFVCLFLPLLLSVFLYLFWSSIIRCRCIWDFMSYCWIKPFIKIKCSFYLWWYSSSWSLTFLILILPHYFMVIIGII